MEAAAVGLSIAASALDTTGFVFDILGGVLYLIPNIDLGVSGFGGTPQAGANTGGENIGNSTARTSQGLSRLAGLLDRAGALVSTQAGYIRRKEEWDFQASQAVLELAHFEKQLAASRLRVAVSEAEIRGHEAQEQSWADIDAILREKFSNEERFEWMIETLRDLYQQAFEHALKLSNTARDCLAYEYPQVTIPTIGQSHWDSLQHGLLAGERLSADLRELDVIAATECSYEREVTQHIALSHVAPEALLNLRQSGGCSFSIPRWWFQRFDPQLTNRRIKMISVTVPSVTGPYMGLNVTLRCQGQHRTPASISLSHGNNDFGVDVGSISEKYMPFEGISLETNTSWSFGFPQDPSNNANRLTDVDYSTIQDVILHIQYYADTGTPTLDGPPQLIAFVDLRQMDADAWTQLVLNPIHQCTVTISQLVPSFLNGYHVSSVLSSTVAVLRDGTAVTNRLSFTPGTGTSTGSLDISLRAGETVDFTKLSKVFIIMRMARE